MLQFYPLRYWHSIHNDLWPRHRSNWYSPLLVWENGMFLLNAENRNTKYLTFVEKHFEKWLNKWSDTTLMFIMGCISSIYWDTILSFFSCLTHPRPLIQSDLGELSARPISHSPSHKNIYCIQLIYGYNWSNVTIVRQTHLPEWRVSQHQTAEHPHWCSLCTDASASSFVPKVGRDSKNGE